MSARNKIFHLCAMVICTLWTPFSPADAGTVYLKNGRVIRGPVVERGDEGVVVGIHGGRMRIYRRFIAAVVYDGSDIAAGEKSPVPRQDTAGNENSSPPDPATEGLPEDPRELLQRLGETAPSAGSPGQPPPANRLETSTGGKSPPRDATQSRGGVEPGKPGEELGEYVDGPVAGVSIRPPAGWKLEKSPAGLRFVESPQGAFTASIELLALPESDLEVGECLRILREEHHAMLVDCETVDESFSRNSPGSEVFEMTSRGSVQAQAVTVHQALIHRGGHFWLLSAFRNSYDMVAGRIQAQSIESLRFSAGEEVSGIR